MRREERKRGKGKPKRRSKIEKRKRQRRIRKKRKEIKKKKKCQTFFATRMSKSHEANERTTNWQIKERARQK
jgi:hypothetical protein